MKLLETDENALAASNGGVVALTVSVLSFEHPLNASPIEVTPVPSVHEVKPVQFLNTSLLITATAAGTVIELNALPWKAPLLIALTDVGIVSADSFVHPLNEVIPVIPPVVIVQEERPVHPP